MIRIRRIALTLLVATLCFALTSCASNGGGIIQPMGDTMDGLFVELRVDKPPGSIALYNVTKDGMIGFAGGAEAKNGESEWSDALTEDEKSQLIAMVDENNWLSREPADSTTNPEHVYRLKVRRGSTRESYVVHGDNPGLVELAAFLDSICRRRFDSFIDTLPQAGPPKR